MPRKPRYLVQSEEACHHIFKVAHVNLEAPALGDADFRRRTQEHRDRAASRGAGRWVGKEGG